MATTERSKGWILILIVGVVGGAPLDEQKIYFPGENPLDEFDARSSQFQSHKSQHNTGQDLSQSAAWSQDGTPPEFGGVATHHFVPQPTYDAAYNEPQSAPQHVERQDLPKIFSSGTPEGLTSQYLPGYQGAYSLGNPSHHQLAYSSIADNGVHHQGQRTKHTWTSHHSTTGTGSLSHEPLHNIHRQDTVRQEFTHQESPSYSSSLHQSHSIKDLSSIIDGPSHQGQELHPNIKQALNSVIRDYGTSQPSHHTVRKVSHIKKTTIQNIGNEPSHIQSTSSNDDISLSHLIEQLQKLEESPQHVNITWCEEKIKEFLRALRRKQASGVYINQQVQEQTLHQVLTHESVESNDSSGGVHEPPMTRATARPLGREDLSQSQEASDFISHEHESQAKETDVKYPVLSVNQTEELSVVHPEVITVIPQPGSHLQPEIMSHQHEKAPPFTSDNTDDLDLELPEYVPFEHAHSGEVNAFESKSQAETRPQFVPFETPMTHSISNEVQQGGTSEAGSVAGQTQHEIISESSNSVHNSYVLHNQEAKSINEHQSETEHPLQSEQRKEEEIHTVSTDKKEAANNAKEVDYDLISSGTEDHHNIHGRPQAAEEETNNVLESGHEEKSVSSEQADNTEVKVAEKHELAMNGSQSDRYSHSQETSSFSVQKLHKQQVDYDTLIEELIQLESIPGHQAIDKCEEKIQEFLEILKYQQQQGFGRNQEELERLHKTLIEQAQERTKQVGNAEETTLPPKSFWRRVQKKIKTTYDSAKDRAKQALG